MKNWKSTLFGILYAALVVGLQQLTEGHIDWMVILQAGIAVVLGASATDPVKAENIFTNIVKEWKTSLAGLIAGTLTVLLPELQGGPITTWTVVKAVSITLLGLLVKDKATAAK